MKSLRKCLVLIASTALHRRITRHKGFKQKTLFLSRFLWGIFLTILLGLIALYSYDNFHISCSKILFSLEDLNNLLINKVFQPQYYVSGARLCQPASDSCSVALSITQNDGISLLAAKHLILRLC